MADITVEQRPVLAFSPTQWREWMREHGYPAYRADQVLEWVVTRRASTFAAMNNVPLALRRLLELEWTPLATRLAARVPTRA